MTTQPLVSIITVNYNGLELTLDLLASIRDQHYNNVEVWVVDNASEGDPTADIKRQFPEVHCLRSEVNLGFAGGNNLAIKQAKGDYIFLVNNDALLTPDCIDILVTFCRACPQVGAVSPLILYHTLPNAPTVVQFAGATAVHRITGRNQIIGEKKQAHEIGDTPQETAYTHGAAMLLPRQVVEKVGLMHEDFFLYYEELDWCERIKKFGFTLFVVGKAKVWHRESASVGALSPLKVFYLTRNRLYFMQRHGSKPTVWLFYAFYLFVGLPKHIFTSILRGRWALIKPALRACMILWRPPQSTAFRA